MCDLEVEGEARDEHVGLEAHLVHAGGRQRDRKPDEPEDGDGTLLRLKFFKMFFQKKTN